MIRLLFGPCLSEINQHIPLWNYVILLPEQEESSISSLLNVSIDDLKQILLTCGLIYYQRGTLKLVLNGWSILKISHVTFFHIPFIPNVMSIILHVIFTLYEQFSTKFILSIKYLCETECMVINIPK